MTSHSRTHEPPSAPSAQKLCSAVEYILLLACSPVCALKCQLTAGQPIAGLAVQCLRPMLTTCATLHPTPTLTLTILSIAEHDPLLPCIAQ